MAWIEVHQSLPTHRKTLQLADELDISPAEAVGHLVTFWLWAIDNAPDGDLTGISARTIARAAQWTGDPASFLAALGSSGFFEISEDIGTIIHDWYEYAGKLIEQRRQDAERKRISRACPADVRWTSNGHPKDVRGTSDVTVPYRTLPNQLPTTTTARAREEEPEGETDALTDAVPPVASEQERTICHELKSIPNYRYHFAEEVEFIRELLVDFPSIDLLEEVKAWKNWLRDKPLKANSRPHSQFRNWCKKALEIRAEREARASPARGKSKAPRRSRDDTPDYILEDQDDYFRRTAIRATVEPDV